MGFIAGAARVNITPPIGIPMSGYAGRTHGADGIRDELWARALYLSDERSAIMLLSADVIGLQRESVERIQEGISQQTGIPGSHVMFSATHTHSGPNCRPSSRDDASPTPDLVTRNLESLEDKLVGAAIWAQARANRAHVYRMQTSTLCGVNRRERRDGEIVLGVNPDGPIDPSVDILHVTNTAGDTVAVWFAHACHPVVMGQRNYHISGDFVGAAARFVEETTGGIALFANGAAGNINPIPGPKDGTFRDVDRLGRRLGAAVLDSLTRTPDTPELHPEIAATEHAVRLPTEAVPTLDEAERRLQEAEEALRHAQEEGDANAATRARRTLTPAQELVEYIQSGGTESGAPIVLSIASIGDLALVGVPCEVFVELGLSVRQRSDFDRTVLLSYTNGSHGYLPTAEAFQEGGYEVNVRVRHRGLAIAPEAGSLMVDESVRALEALHQGLGERVASGT